MKRSDEPGPRGGPCPSTMPWPTRWKGAGSNARQSSEVPAAFIAPCEGFRPHGHRPDDGVSALPIVRGIVGQLRLAAPDVPTFRADPKVHRAARNVGTSGAASRSWPTI